MRAYRLGLWPLAVAIGVAGESIAYGWSDARNAVPDVVAGWSLIACGLVCWARRPESRSGALMTAAGFSWFAGNFETSSIRGIGWLAEHALYLHRAPLVALVLTYPSGKGAGRLVRATVALACADAFVLPIAQNDVVTFALALLVLAVAWRGYARSRGRARRSHLAALHATTALSALFAGSAAARLAIATVDAERAVLLAYQVGLAALAAALLAGIIYAPWEHAAIGELVAELGDARSGPMRDALARALGDPSLQLGYWLPELAAYVDTRGHPIDLPPVAANRSVMRIDRGGQAVAILVHDPVVLDDPELEEAVASVARLAAANARLQAEVRNQLSELEASRLRLLRSGDAERRRLEERLRDGAERRLLELRSTLVCAQARAASGSEVGVRVAQAEEQRAHTLAELRELARGLHPRALRDLGLAGALAALAEQSPVPVELALSCDDLSDEVGVAVYFVCSEALSNAAKYASASLVTVRVAATAARVEVEVSDNGSGGADAARGSGLRGLSDRVESLGGTLGIESRPGHGTAVFAVLPRHAPRPIVR